MASPSKPRVLAHVPSVRESKYSAASTAQAPAAAPTAGDSAVADENHEGEDSVATKAMKQLAKTFKCTFCDKRVGKTQSFFYDGLDKGIICWNCLAGVN